MGNTAHLPNKTAGIEMTASRDHPFVLSSGIHRGTTVQRAARLGPVHLAARSVYSSNSLSAGQTCGRFSVLSEQHCLQFLNEASDTFTL